MSVVNIIVVSKNKLIGLDGVLPVLLELKTASPQSKVLLVLVSDEQEDLVRRNYNIWEAVEKLEAQVLVLRTTNKALLLWRLLVFLSKVVFRRNIVLKDVDALPQHRLMMGLLKRVSCTTEVKTYLSFNSPLCHQKLYVERLLTCELRGREDVGFRFFAGEYDHFLSSLSAEDFRRFYQAQPPEGKIVTTGYLRGLPQWQKFLKEAAGRNPIVNGPPYFLYVLSCVNKRLDVYREPELIELIEESLGVLGKFSPRLRAVFKPHPITDMERVEGVLKKLGYRNYVIDYGHPMVLSSGAKFIFGNVFSATMVDAYYQGIPVVEYAAYDAELLRRLGNGSYGGALCDHFIQRDPRQLEKVVSDILSGAVRPERPESVMRENFPPPPQEFHHLLKEMSR